jgi:uncharacterized protein YaaR (DUF327 family)
MSSLLSESTATITTNRKQTPSEFLKQIIGRAVVVKLNSGVDYRGDTFKFELLNIIQQTKLN